MRFLGIAGSFAAAAMLAAACTTAVPGDLVQWNATSPVAGPPVDQTASAGGEGWIRLETDRDPAWNGDLKIWVRRPFDLYSADGERLRASIDNQGWRNGEEPRAVALKPGQYVVASVYGTVYRKVQVEIRPGLTTEVPEVVLREAPPVFPQR